MSETAFEKLVIESLKELKAEIVAVGSVAEQGLNIATKTYEQAKRTNGRVDLLEEWRDVIENDGEAAAAYEAGRKSVRDGDRAVANRLWSQFGKYVIMSTGAILVGVGVRIGAWFLGGGPW